MTKTRRTYTDEFKREAVQLLGTSGKSARHASLAASAPGNDSAADTFVPYSIPFCLE